MQECLTEIRKQKMTVYQNKFLKLDLSKREAVETPLDPDVVRDFLGGRGFGIEYLYKHLPPPYGPPQS